MYGCTMLMYLITQALHKT